MTQGIPIEVVMGIDQPIDQTTKIKTVNNMRTYGGSFVKALAEVIVKADRTNLKKLMAAFPDYFEEYHPSKWSR